MNKSMNEFEVAKLDLRFNVIEIVDFINKASDNRDHALTISVSRLSHLRDENRRRIVAIQESAQGKLTSNDDPGPTETQTSSSFSSDPRFMLETAQKLRLNILEIISVANDMADRHRSEHRSEFVSGGLNQC